MPADINSIIDLDFRRASVCIKLSQTMLRDDPELATRWRDLHLDYMTAHFPHREPFLTPLDLVGDSVKLLLPHPRYGYVAEWLDEWRKVSLAMRDDIRREHGLTTRDLDALMNAELSRRRGVGMKALPLALAALLTVDGAASAVPPSPPAPSSSTSRTSRGGTYGASARQSSSRPPSSTARGATSGLSSPGTCRRGYSSGRWGRPTALPGLPEDTPGPSSSRRRYRG